LEEGRKRKEGGKGDNALGGLGLGLNDDVRLGVCKRAGVQPSGDIEGVWTVTRDLLNLKKGRNEGNIR